MADYTKGRIDMKKNCNNCKYLSYEEDHDSDGRYIGGGYMCEKRYEKEADKGTEHKLEQNLEREEYRLKGKVCFEAKAT